MSSLTHKCLQRMEIYANFLSGMAEGFTTLVYQIYFPERNGVQQRITTTATGNGGTANCSPKSRQITAQTALAKMEGPVFSLTAIGCTTVPVLRNSREGTAR